MANLPPGEGEALAEQPASSNEEANNLQLDQPAVENQAESQNEVDVANSTTEVEQDVDSTENQTVPRDEEIKSQTLTPEQEAEKKQEIMNVMQDWGIEPSHLKTFQKLTKDYDFPQFVEAAITLYPGTDEFLEKLGEVDGLDLDEVEKNQAKAQEASRGIAKLAESMGLSLTEADEKLANLALTILATGQEKLATWFKESWKNSDLERLLDAIVKGADYNSSAALSRLEKEAGANAVSPEDFFKFFQDPKKSLSELRKTAKDLDQELNWGKGEEILSQAANKTRAEQEQALQAYLTQMYQVIEQSSAPHLYRQQASVTLAKKVFNKDVLAGGVWVDLDDMSSGKTTLAQLTK